jgi:hypothetical protein
MRTTHTYVMMELSAEAFEEIRGKLVHAGYGDTFIEEEGRLRIPMQGIAVTSVTANAPALRGQANFREHLDKAAREVSGWAKWKQRILG